MQFTVTYRSRSGTVNTEVFDSASRAELFRQLQGRGISPIKVAEGAQGAKPKSGGKVGKGEARRSLPVRYWLIVALALAVGACVWLCVGPAKSRPYAVQIPTAKPVPKKAPMHVVPKPISSDVQATNVNTIVKMDVAMQQNNAAIRNSIFDITNLTGEAVTPEQKLYRKRLAAISNRVFKTASDQLLAMALSSDDSAMPPLPIGSSADTDFRKSLETPIEVLDSDSPEVRALKENIAEARAEMSRMLAKGYTVQEVLAERSKLVAENSEIRRNAERELRAIEESGDMESARKYANSVNAALQQMGIRPIDFGKPTVAQRVAEARERRRAAVEQSKEKGDRK